MDCPTDPLKALIQFLVDKVEELRKNVEAQPLQMGVGIASQIGPTTNLPSVEGNWADLLTPLHLVKAKIYGLLDASEFAEVCHPKKAN